MLATSLMLRARKLLATVRTTLTPFTTRRRPGSPVNAEPLHRELNRTARFWPAEEAPDGDDTLPALEYGGLLCFVYRDPETEEVQVSIDLDTVDPRLVNRDAPGEPVPMHITIQGETVFRTNADPVAAALHQMLRLLDPTPTDSDHPQPADANHDNLVTALTALGTPHRQTGDSAGQYVVVDLPGSHVMHVHNPMDEAYGFDWDIVDGSAQQILTGTWWLGSAGTAHRIHSLLSALLR